MRDAEFRILDTWVKFADLLLGLPAEGGDCELRNDMAKS